MSWVSQDGLLGVTFTTGCGKRTLEDRLSAMMVACEQAQLMANLVKLIKAKNVIEVGVYTGYNTLNMVLAVPDDGKVLAYDINLEVVNIGKPFWKEAGVEHKIDLRIKPATETLDELLEAGEAGSFDFAFIDADKVLWGGKVLNSGNDLDTLGIAKLNEKIYRDSRVNISILTSGDGVTLAFKQ